MAVRYTRQELTDLKRKDLVALYKSLKIGGKVQVKNKPMLIQCIIEHQAGLHASPTGRLPREPKVQNFPPPQKGRPGQSLVRGQLEIDHARGVLYFHAAEGPWAGCSLLRVCGLGPSVPQDRQVDLALSEPQGRDWGTGWAVMYGDLSPCSTPEARLLRDTFAQGAVEELSVEDLGGEAVLRAAGLEPADAPSPGTDLLAAVDWLADEAKACADMEFKAGTEGPADADELRNDASTRLHNAKVVFTRKLQGVFKKPDRGVQREVVYKLLLRTHGDGMATENLSDVADMIIEALAR